MTNDEDLIKEANKRKAVQRLEKQSAVLKEQIANTPDAHNRKKAALQEQRKEVQKQIREKRKDFTGIVQIAADTPGKVAQATNAAATAAKKAVKDVTVTTIQGKTEDVGKITHHKSDNELPNQVN